MPKHAAPTQTRYPWRTILRTLVQVVPAVAALVPLVIHASGIPETFPGVAAALALSAGICRVMALPAVEQFLRRWAPWLAAEPAPDPISVDGDGSSLSFYGRHR